MALERKDIRAKLDPELHAALKAMCDLDGVDMGEWIEAQLVPVIRSVSMTLLCWRPSSSAWE